MKSYKQLSMQARSPFADVTPPGRRTPSWIVKQGGTDTEAHTLSPAPIPREFVSALQAEINRSPVSEFEGREQMGSLQALSRGSLQGSLEPAPPQENSLSLARHSSAPPCQAPAESAETEVSGSPSGQLNPEQTEALARAIEQLVSARTIVFETAAAQLAELAATIAHRVISRELSINPNVVRQLVDEGLRYLEHRDRLLVRLGPAFAEYEQELLDHLATQADKVEILTDPQLSDFGCVVETEHGWIDESIEARLATLLQELRADSDPP